MIIDKATNAIIVNPKPGAFLELVGVVVNVVGTFLEIYWN